MPNAAKRINAVAIGHTRIPKGGDDLHDLPAFVVVLDVVVVVLCPFAVYISHTHMHSGIKQRPRAPPLSL